RNARHPGCSIPPRKALLAGTSLFAMGRPCLCGFLYICWRSRYWRGLAARTNRLSNGVLCSSVFRHVWSGVCIFVLSLAGASVTVQESQDQIAASLFPTRDFLAGSWPGSDSLFRNGRRENSNAAEKTNAGITAGLDRNGFRRPLDGPKPCRLDAAGHSHGLVFRNRGCCGCFRLLVDHSPDC